ncbi:dolichyl-diphosphooligosaccharide--protein glycosyltransferase subunit 1 [Gracilaria domingensis]|nr:dolichyl-diphosphooligosaccharide--protein glycosyltransferase subunit 1 [Gracilaria domingensis]
MKNTASESVSSFHIAFPSVHSAHITDMWITEKSSSVRSMHTAFQVQPVSALSGMCDDCTAYQVQLPEPLAPEQEIFVELRSDIKHVLYPVPPELDGFASQYMKFDGTAYFYTPYHTKSMRTVLVLGSADIKSKSGFIEPVKQTGKRIEMGPYSDVPPFSTAHISVRFKNDRGFLMADVMEKSFYINHWGSISVREEYRLKNAAADHRGEWSRVDHSGFRSKYATALGDVWANLPADAHDVDYKDLVGNVTSSRLRLPSKGKRPLQLTFRYPMMGGWNNHFWITYQLVHDKYVSSNASHHVAQLPLFSSLNVDLYCEKLMVKVYLPDGAGGETGFKHPSLSFDTMQSTEWTTLSVLGRPTLTFSLNDIRSQSKHWPVLSIVYSFNTVLTWVAPLFVGCGVVIVLVLCIALARNGVLTDEQEHPLKSKKLQ